MAVVRQGSQGTMLQCGSGTHFKVQLIPYLTMIQLCLSSQISYTQETPSVVPPAVEELLMKQHLDWTSQT